MGIIGSNVDLSSMTLDSSSPSEFGLKGFPESYLQCSSFLCWWLLSSSSRCVLWCRAFCAWFELEQGVPGEDCYDAGWPEDEVRSELEDSDIVRDEPQYRDGDGGEEECECWSVLVVVEEFVYDEQPEDADEQLD